MSKSFLFAAATSLCVTCLVGNAAFGQLFTENFDVDATANWTLNAPIGDPPTSVADFYGDVFFDYSTVGVPSAPNSGGTTRGLLLQANLINGVFGGGSIAHWAEFSGDYKVTFDLWGNYTGPLELGGSGTTNLSTFGIMSDGVTAVYPGVAEAIWFAATIDGGSSADYRAYSIERPVSYQEPGTTPEDEHATYHAGGRNQSAALYADNFGGASAPAAQASLFPSTDLSGMTRDGVLGFEWHEVEIVKSGNTVDWNVDGINLITVDTTDFVTQPDGENIFFGHSDVNDSSSSDFDAIDLIFSLVDNVVVDELTVDDLEGDYNDSDAVEQGDLDLVLLNWGNTVPPAPTGWNNATYQPTEPAINQDDLDGVLLNWGNTAMTSAASAVPEPTGLVLLALAGLSFLAHRRS